MDAITDTKKVASTDRIYPKVVGWALAELTQESEQQQQIEIKDIMARVHGETDRAIAVEEAEVHETCPTCGHTKTYIKVERDENPKRSKRDQ
jgi:predicted RNA-binding Zn-ribbon protein involved in translation (DUF1610 family)